MESRAHYRSYQVSRLKGFHTCQDLTDRTCLRLIILGITRRPVLNPPIPQREFDITSLPDIVGEASGLSAQPSPSSSGKPALESIAPGAPLRSHLYPMAGSLPESHLAHPLTLLPELSASAFTSEILTSTATLVHVLLLLRAQVSQIILTSPSARVRLTI
jgi:peroxin-16